MLRIGIDTGGTFTDFVVLDGQRMVVVKLPSTPKAPERAVLEGLAKLVKGRKEFLLQHGSTVATNAFLERKGFALLSDSMAAVARRFGTTGRDPVLRFHCPMAFNNRGGYWLQNRESTENPYFGSAMFKCGEITETIITGAAS